MKRVLTAVVLVPIVLVVVFKAPLWVFAAVAGAFAVAAAYEYLALASRIEEAVPVAPATLVITAAFSSWAITVSGFNFGGMQVFRYISALPTVLVLLFPIVLLAAQMRLADPKRAAISTALTALVIPYVALPFACLIWLRMASWFFLIWLFFVVWSGDIFAYYVGKNLGKNLLAPRVSPKKTWEGTVASVVGSAIISVLLCANVTIIEQWLLANKVLPSISVFGSTPSLQPPPIWLAALLAMIVNLAAQVGDLAESMIKRAADVKDSGHLLPGHGGVLDRVDALLFGAPVAMLLFSIFGSYFRIGP